MENHNITRKEAKSLGLTLYFTGAPCIHGHFCERWTCSARCKECQRQSSKSHNFENKDKYAAKSKAYNKARYEENKSKILADNKAWRNANKKRRAEYQKEWRAKNKKYLDLYLAEYRKKEHYKIANHIRNSTKRILTGRGGSKKLGYTRLELMHHIERQFKKGMSWGNYGDWEIDHIIPIRHFLDEGVSDVSIVNAILNLRPIWRFENRSKSGFRDLLL